jgi:lysophospholipase L1-like esterase
MRKIFYFCLAVVVVALAGQTFFKPRPSRAPLPASGKIVCFGDSLTSGVGATAGKDYPAQLSLMLSRPVVNAGRSGDTTDSAANRLHNDVLSHSPHLVLLSLGANDLIRGVPKDVAFRNLKAMIEKIQASGALVIVGGVDVPIWGRGYGAMYQQLCRETGTDCVPNVLEGIWGNQALMSDPLHPNDAGYQRMAQFFNRALKPYL